MKKLYKYTILPFFAIILMYTTKTVEYILGIDFHNYGIFPQLLEGLKGILFSPFIHGSFEHLYSNTVPFLLLSTAILYFYRNVAFKVIAYMWLLSGFGVWLGARPHWHIGASGLIYAFASFLFFAGILNKSRQLIAISLLVSFLYGGIIWGILPQTERISWESHLFGFISGIIMAFFYGKQERFNQAANIKAIEDYTHSSASMKVSFKYFYSEINED